MSLEDRYPDGYWEESKTYTCSFCGEPTEIFVVEEIHPSTGEPVEYMKGERCVDCDWIIDTDSM